MNKEETLRSHCKLLWQALCEAAESAEVLGEDLEDDARESLDEDMARWAAVLADTEESTL